MKKLAFIGPPCSGKSTLAAACAARFGCTAIDTDEEFTRRYGDISAFFGAHGEAEFRKAEHGLIVEAANSDADIVACGGGAVLDKFGMSALRKTRDIVYVTAKTSVLEDRIKDTDRPLKNELNRILNERETLYKRYADYTVSGEGDMLGELVKTIDSPRKNRYDVVLCDADDTLLDFKRAMRASITAAAHAVGAKSSDDKIVSAFAEITKEIWGRLERKEITRERLDIERFVLLRQSLSESFDPQKMCVTFIAEMKKTRYILDRSIEFLHALTARGIKVYIVTNGFTEIANERLKALDGAIDGAFISGELGYDKPDIRFFDKVHAAIGHPDKSRILVFGDSPSSDIAGGRAFGVDTCLFDPEHTKHAECDYTVRSYEEVLEIV